MDLRKCCVGNCDSTNRTHRLFYLPKDDNLRNLWLSFLIPTNIELSGLSKEQLLTKRVCQNHFDRHQFDNLGNRLSNGYPCLFSAKEISYGVPLSSTDVDHLSDHNYYCLTTVPESMESISTTAIEVQGDHSYYKLAECDIPEPMEISDETIEQVAMVPETSGSANIVVQKGIMKLQKKCVQKLAKPKKDVSERIGFAKQLKKRAIAVREMPFSERLAEAEAFNQNVRFMKNFVKINKQAQNFIMMQLKAVNKKNKGMRFTDDEKLLALTLMKESPKGYKLLQKIFKLPAKRTLNRLAEKITFGVGINENLFRLIKNKSMNWDIKKKICAIVFDEMALTPHLTYVESKDEIYGFKDLGNQKIMKFSDHVLVFMLRGVCSNWRQPIAYYFCEGSTSAADIIRILKELVAKVSQSDLIPLALICDQGATFRSALKMLRMDTIHKRNLNGELNDGTIEISGQKLSVLFDPPHLLKGIRNNFLTKNMLFNGAIAKWDDIMAVYLNDCQLGHTRMNKKLTDQHVIPSKIKKMKVSAAAQVLSAQTSAMLKYTSLFSTTLNGDNISQSMRTTGEAVEFFDQLFDSVNGSKSSTKKGKMRGPIKPKSGHLKFWRDAIKILNNIRFVDSASKRAIQNKTQYYIRVPSLDGWVTSLESLERIANILFEKYKLSYFYPRLLNQDPLENFFGRIRAINYRNVNPDAYTFVNAFKSLLISNIMGPHSLYSNCEEDKGQNLIDFFHLLKENISSDEKENMPVFDTNFMPATVSFSSEQGSDIKITALNAINEKMRVHSSAYTAGYLCRKLTKNINCKYCQATYIAKYKENIHEWILQREYKQLKNSNLAYPSKQFLLLYRDMTNLIHCELNKYGHIKSVGQRIKFEILKLNLSWLGCKNHKETVKTYLIKLILRTHIHNWCTIINRILKGDIPTKYVLKMKDPQILAYNKYKSHRLRNKNK